jgi:hypothetical protein
MEETLTDRSNLQKQLARLVDLNLIEYTPGRGAGNYSRFRLRALDFEEPTRVERAVIKAVEKAVVLRPLIRKEDQNQDQIQNSPSRQRDFDLRDMRLMGEAFRYLTKRNAQGSCLGATMTEDEFLAFQCRHAGIDLERGRYLNEKQLRTDAKKPQGAVAS